MTPAQDPKQRKIKKKKTRKIKNYENVNHQKLSIFEGFSSNGLQIRIQRNELHILTLVKIDFDYF